MAQNRGQYDAGGNNVQKQGPGDMIMDQKRAYAVTVAGAATLPAEAILSGIVRRSGPAAGFNDTFPDAATLLAACPQLTKDDSFEFLYQNTVAQAMTAVAGIGVVLGNNPNVAASAVRRYMVTVLGDGLGGTFSFGTTNGQPTITFGGQLNIAGLSGGIKNIRVGQGVSGTGIPANTVVTAVNYTTGQVTLNNNATATGSIVGLTFFPRYQVEGLYSATA